MNKINTSKFLLIDNLDNVLVCCNKTNPGEIVKIGDVFITLNDSFEVGHKIARNNISKNQKVIRYGVSIGSAIVDIVIGEHVHMHNMKSDYISSHTRQSLVGE